MKSAFRGITIIEVLTSIIIATIGVAGVMILIPFAVGQAEQGFSQDMANQLGQNAAADIEVKGFTNTNRWRTVQSFTGNTINGVGGSTVRCYVIDPIGVAARGQSSSIAVNNNSGYFPFVAPVLEALIGTSASNAYQPNPPPPQPSADTCLLMERVSLESSAGALFSRGLADLSFSWRDDLVFRSPTSTETVGFYPSPDLAPPQQVYDISSSGNMRRQAGGKMSYVVVSVPDPGTSIPNPGGYPLDPTPLPPIPGNADLVGAFRDYVLLYRSRPLPVTFGTGPLEAYDRVYQVSHPFPNYSTAPPPPPPPYVPPSQYLRYLTAGGTVTLTEPAPLAAANALSSQRPEIRPGDWMALTNVSFNVGIQRFVQQVQFYQVLDATVFGTDRVVTLQGPDFDLQQAYDQTLVLLDPQVYNNFRDYAAQVTTGAVTEYYPSKTYAIHLPDVWTVIERTYR